MREAVIGRRRRAAFVVFCAAPLVAMAMAVPPAARPTERPPALAPQVVRSAHGAVSSGSPQASEAGARILAAGGNAVDAAVAVALALGVAEPNGSGLGGQTSALLVLRDGRRIAIDGSASVPLSVRRDELAAHLAGAPRPEGYWAVATPGSLAALTHMLRRYGSMSFAEVAQPAIAIAEDGYLLQSCQHAFLGDYAPQLVSHYYGFGAFLRPDRELKQPPELVCLPDLATTLRELVANGPESFYRGAIAARIAADMEANGGAVTRADLARVRAVERAPLSSSYRGQEVLAVPAPGGGAALLEALHILERFPSELLRTAGADRLHLIAEAIRIAEADWRRSLTRDLAATARQLERQHAAERAELIRMDRKLDLSVLGAAPPAWPAQRSTSHLTVMDRAGNAVTMTQSIGRQFGAKVATPGLGFLYNCLLEAFDPVRPESPVFMRPGAVPATTMTPAMLLHDARPVLGLGNAGGDRLLSGIVNVIVATVDGGLALPDAIAEPRVLWSGNDDKLYLELAPPITAEHADELARRGFEPMYRQHFPPRPIDVAAFGGINAVSFDPTSGLYTAVADPRRDGTGAVPSGKR